MKLHTNSSSLFTLLRFSFDSHGARLNARERRTRGKGEGSTCACSIFTMLLRICSLDVGLLSRRQSSLLIRSSFFKMKIVCVCVYVCVWHRFFDYDPSSDLSVCPLAPPPSVPSLLFFMIFFIIRCLINFVINFIPVFHFVSIHPRSKVIGLKGK